MQTRNLLPIVIGCMALLQAGPGLADVPPPPANQDIGMSDVTIGNLTEADCRVCHSSGVPDRHHLLYGEPIPEGSIVLNPGASGECTLDPNYGCLNCHDSDGAGGFIVIRDCIACHTTGRHHTVTAALDGDCTACHGDLVDEIDDFHYIPTYDPSLVTPKRSSGYGQPLNTRNKGAGTCDYCHDFDGLMPSTILPNQALHHYANSADCEWCHDFTSPVEYQIRECEGCHGPDSLHNIQADSDGNGIVVGGEVAGYGHVGRDAGPGDSDCWGCHGFANIYRSNSNNSYPEGHHLLYEATSEADCRVCHSSGVPDRHHLLYDQSIPEGSIVPYPDADGDSSPETNYRCLNCHGTSLTVVRDCLVCHQPPVVQDVIVDIKPDQDSNSVNFKSKGVLNLAILGSGDYHVSEIDVSKLFLIVKDAPSTNVFPLQVSLEAGASGYMDLILKFSIEDVQNALGDPQLGETYEFCIIGKFTDGTYLLGCDSLNVKK